MGPTGRLVTIKRSGVDGPHFPLSLSTCLFGRGIECDIRIQLPVVSKQHCKIEIHEQKATLFNFSATNPTQVNGSAIDGPVQLKHGDVITVIDRSFRYENDSHQNESKSTENPGQRREQASLRRVSRSSFSSDPDGQAQDPSVARAQLPGEGAAGARPDRREDGAAAPRGPGGPAARSAAELPPAGPPGESRRSAAGPAAGGTREGCPGTAVSGSGGREPLPSAQCPEKGGEDESPFRKLYESMKEVLDVKSEKENVPQNRRRSGSQGHCASGSERGPQGATPPWASPRSRRRSHRSSQTKATPAPGQRGSSPTEEGGAGERPGQTLGATASLMVPPTETKATTPAQCTQQNSSRKRRSGDLSVARGGESASLEPSEGCGVNKAAETPQRVSARQQPPPRGGVTDGPGNTPEKAFSRKRRSSLPPNVNILATETEIQKQTMLSPLMVHVERKVPGSSLGTPEQLGTTAGSPGLSPVDVSNVGDSLNKTEGLPLKRRRVSFGGHLRPELFDENLPPNTPLKRGETPMKRRSLVTHTPTVLKKIIKEQPQQSEKEDSSEVHLEVTTQNVLMSSPARNPTKTPPVANEGRRRSSKPPAPSGSKSPHQADVPKRAGRRSSGAASRRASVDRGQHELLQMIHSRRRSGASEANLIVARSWADVVKLCAKQTQTKVVRHVPPRQPSKRQRRINTPKKPPGSVHSEFSTGHAASPCTIVIGKAHIEKVNVPARPYRMLNNFVFNKKIDFNEDLSGLTEMFKTPGKEKPQTMNIYSTTFSNSEDMLGEEFQVPNSEGKPLLRTPENFGENVLSGAQNAPEEPSHKKSSSPTLTQQYITVHESMKTPRSEAEPPKVAPSAHKFRRSVELRNIQVTGTECDKNDREVGTIQNTLGRCLRNSSVPAQLPEGAMKDNERVFETCKKNIEPKENSEKLTAVRRSRRSSELKCAPRADLIAIKRLQETESKKDLVGIHSSLRNPSDTEEPVDTENKTTLMLCKSPGPVSTPTRMNTRIQTPSQSVSAEGLSALRKPRQTPQDRTPTHKEPEGGDRSMEAFKEAPEQKLDSAENVIGSRRRSGTPKRKVQPIEDMAGFKELFQTPNHIVETVTDDKTTKVPCKSPKPEPVSTPTSTRRRFRTPLGKVDMEEELSALRKPTPTPGGTTHSHREPEADDKSIRAFKETPKQKLDSAESVTGRRRRSGTPKRKAQPIEDLAGFKELFQTPDHTVAPMADDKTSEVLCQSPQPEPGITPTSMTRRLRTPLGKVDMEGELSALGKPTPVPGKTTHSHRQPEGDQGIKAFKETPEQKLDSAENVIGSRRRSGTPKRKVQPTEDLAGFKELFQTPIHIIETATDDKTTKVPCKSPKPEPVSTPTSTKRCFKTPLGKVDLEEELPALRKPAPTPEKTMCSLREPVGDGKSIESFKELPEQKLNSAENVIGSRRRSGTPKRKVQPIEDMAGFKELFQTPDHTVAPMADDKTSEVLCQSPQPEPGITPTSMTRRLRTPLGKVDMEGELSALGKPTPVPGKTTHSHRQPEGDQGIKAFKETPEQKLDSAENVIGSRRRSGTPKRKVQPTEDLAGFKELFQTPIHIIETATDDKTTKVPCKSPKPVSTPTSIKNHLRTSLGKVDMEEELSVLRMPTPTPEKTCSPREPVGDGKSIEFFKETPEQKLNSAENVIGSRRRSGTPKRKVQPTEDLAGFKELFQTPDHTGETVTDDDRTTKEPCTSQKPEPVIMPTGRNRRVKAPPGKVATEDELLAPRRPTCTSGKTTRSRRGTEAAAKDVKLLKEAPEEKLDPAENVTGSKRRPRTRKERAQPLEDPASLRESFQIPSHTEEPETAAETSTLPPTCPQPEAVVLPARRRGRLRAPAGKVPAEDALSAPRKPTRASGKTTTRSHREPEVAYQDIKLLKEAPEEKLDPAENVTGSKRRPRTRKEKAQPLEDPASLRESSQVSGHTEEPETVVKTGTLPPTCPQPEAAVLPAPQGRRLRAPAGKVPVEDAPSAPRTSRKTTRSHREPVAGDKDIEAFKEPPRQKPGPTGNDAGSKRRLRSRKEKAQPPEGPASCKQLSQSPAQGKELGTGAESDTRAPTPRQTPDRGKPARPRRVLRAPKVRPVEDLGGSRDPVEPQSESGASQSPERKPEDGSATGARRLRTRSRAQDAAEEKPPPKRPRTAPRERREPPEPLALKSRRELAESTGPVEGAPSKDVETKNRGRRAQVVTSPDKGKFLRSRRPNKTSEAEQRPEILIAAEVKIKRSGKKPADTAHEAKIQNPGDGALNSAPGDAAPEKSVGLRSARRGKAPVPSGAEQKAGGRSVEIQAKTREEEGGAQGAGFTRLRSRKVTAPPAGDTSESQSQQRVTRSAKRPAESATQENSSVGIKKMRTRSRRGSGNV
ncbi:PREDICTED: antigen KI-67 isoform X2 [Miniopterus natalensis]|uniref:antigen KI-67 isoform X2 n=1 Tax=Miniopterus natalensis TaxID=291302 RepID=UPI0007A725D2|nr:PREDICTED: antigen KI-67 isoform X2 [Miniopterus natalensis]